MTFQNCKPERPAQKAYERTYITNDPWVPQPLAHTTHQVRTRSPRRCLISPTRCIGDYKKTYITTDSWVPLPVAQHTESTLKGWEELYEKRDDNNIILAAGVASKEQVEQNLGELPEYYRGFYVLDENGDVVPKTNYDEYVSRCL